MMTDPIADMLSRIRNASMVRKPHVHVPYSKLKQTIANLLSQEGYVGKVEVVEEAHVSRMLSIELLYCNGMSRIAHLKKESKPGLRVYVKKHEIPDVCNRYGMAILSTSRGMLTGEHAKAQGVGGELICTVY